ncbi:hypothetical protein C0993_005181, partial [Termitomyces sp. T159_Od127]
TSTVSFSPHRTVSTRERHSSPLALLHLERASPTMSRSLMVKQVHSGITVNSVSSTWTAFVALSLSM